MKNTSKFKLLIIFIFLSILSCGERQEEPIILRQLSGKRIDDESMKSLFRLKDENPNKGGWVADGEEVFYREVTGTPEFYLSDIGHIAKVSKSNGNPNITIYLNNCLSDTFNLNKNIVIPKIVPRDFTMYDSTIVASASIMGLSGSINKKESMKYESKTLLSSFVTNSDLNFTNIPSWADCTSDTCSYWIVKDVSIREVYFRKYSLREKEIKVQELPYIGNAISASGKFWSSNIRENEVAKYFVIYRLMKYRKQNN